MHPNFAPYMPGLVKGTVTNYILDAPERAPCWYCGKDCLRDPGDPYSDTGSQREFIYLCHRHDPLTPALHCVRHEVSPPNWFFNRIKIRYKTLTLFHHFYNPIDTEVQELVRDTFPGRFKRVITSYPPDMIHWSADRHLAFLKMFRVFS